MNLRKHATPQHPGIQLCQRDRILIVGGEGARHEDTGVVRHYERRCLVLAGARELHFEVVDNRVDVKDVTGNELFEDVARAIIAEGIERAP